MYDKRLDTFLSVASLGSFAKAAAAHSISVSTVAAHMSGLESALNVKLLERSPRGVALTDAGRTLQEEAKGLVAFSESIVASLHDAAAQAFNLVRIGSSSLQPHQELMRLWRLAKPFARDEFRFQFVPFEDGDKTIRSSVSDPRRMIDAIIFAGDKIEDSDICKTVSLTELPVRILIPLSNPLSGEMRISVDQLDGQSILLVKEGLSDLVDGVRHLLAARLPHATFVDEPSSYDLNTFERCAREGHVMLSYDRWRNVHPDLATVAVDWDVAFPLCLLCARDPSPEVAAFVATLERARDAGAFEGVEL